MTKQPSSVSSTTSIFISLSVFQKFSYASGYVSGYVSGHVSGFIFTPSAQGNQVPLDCCQTEVHVKRRLPAQAAFCVDKRPTFAQASRHTAQKPSLIANSAATILTFGKLSASL